MADIRILVMSIDLSGYGDNDHPGNSEDGLRFACQDSPARQRRAA